MRYVDDQEGRIQDLTPQDYLTRHIYEAEKERVMYLLTSYLRMRLRKVRFCCARSSKTLLWSLSAATPLR